MKSSKIKKACNHKYTRAWTAQTKVLCEDCGADVTPAQIATPFFKEKEQACICHCHTDCDFSPHNYTSDCKTYKRKCKHCQPQENEQPTCEVFCGCHPKHTCIYVDCPHKKTPPSSSCGAVVESFDPNPKYDKKKRINYVQVGDVKYVPETLISQTLAKEKAKSYEEGKTKGYWIGLESGKELAVEAKKQAIEQTLSAVVKYYGLHEEDLDQLKKDLLSK